MIYEESDLNTKLFCAFQITTLELSEIRTCSCMQYSVEDCDSRIVEIRCPTFNISHNWILITLIPPRLFTPSRIIHLILSLKFVELFKWKSTNYLLVTLLVPTFSEEFHLFIFSTQASSFNIFFDSGTGAETGKEAPFDTGIRWQHIYKQALISDSAIWYPE